MRGLFILFLICFTVEASNDTAQFSEKSVRSGAMSTLGSFLDKIPPSYESQYGFRNRAEFSRASIGTPVQVFTIHPDSIKNGIDLKRKYLIPLDEWRVPVLVDGEYRSLLTVSKVNSTLTAVELGGALLAKELEQFRKNHPGGRKVMLRLYQLQCDFMVLDREGTSIDEGEYYPLRSARLIFKSLRQDAAHRYSRKDVLPNIHQKYVEKLRSGR